MRKLLIVLFVLGILQSAYGQGEKTVKGKVVNTSGEALIGVSVRHKKTGRVTVTKPDGAFEIVLPPNAVLSFSYIGYRPHEQVVGESTQLHIVLQEEDKSLNEVVVVGYGTQKRKDISGAIASVSGSELAKVPVQSVAQALQGRLAGVQVAASDGTPGAEPSIKVRGGSSITQSNEPLYVVDGVPQTDGLAFLDPMDIESIEVLKDASEASIYGARGANGVILVTTKKIKGGRLNLSYDGYVGAKNITNTLPVMGTRDFLLMTYERAVGRGGGLLDEYEQYYGAFDKMDSIYAGRPGINWQDKVFGRTVYNQYHKVSVNGGSNDTKFNLFFSRNKDEGILLNSGSTKNVAKLTVTHNVNKKLQVTGIVNYSNQLITGMNTQEGAGTSLVNLLLQYRPTNGVKGGDETLEDMELDPLNTANNLLFQSPVIALNTFNRENRLKALNTSASIRYTITPKLVYSGLASYTDNSRREKFFVTAKNLGAVRSGGPYGGINDWYGHQFNYNNTLTYSDVLAKHHRFDVTAGQEYIYNYRENLDVKAQAFPVVNQGWDRLDLGTIPTFPSTFAEDDRLLSFFGRVNYAYRGKYLFKFTVRADGSSKFDEQNRWGIFPSASAAWRIVEEPFLQNQRLLSDLKLRASYGVTGNNRIANYMAFGIFSNTSYNLNNQVNPGVFKSSLANPGLKWEAVKATNLGIDVGFLKQRITLTAEFYDNRSKDLLFQSRIPSSAGFATQIRNIGVTSSRGIELTLNATNVKTADFSWNTSLNISFGKTKVLSLTEDEKSMFVNSWRTSPSDYILEVGKPVGMMYGYIQDGLYQVEDFTFNPANNTYTLKDGVVKDQTAVRPGYIKFRDLSGPDGKPDGLINEFDRTYIGNANPKYFGGLNNTFTYKGIDLSVFLNFTVGNSIYNATKLANSSQFNNFQNSLAYFKDRWLIIDPATGQRVTDPTQLAALNKGKTIPAFDGAVATRLYDKMIEDGSFLRINNVSLGYTLPRLWLSKARISSARIYFTAYNLHVFTKYTGYDPEVSTIRNPLTPGVDYSAYPRSRSFLAGLNLTL